MDYMDLFDNSSSKNNINDYMDLFGNESDNYWKTHKLPSNENKLPIGQQISKQMPYNQPKPTGFLNNISNWYQTSPTLNALTNAVVKPEEIRPSLPGPAVMYPITQNVNEQMPSTPSLPPLPPAALTPMTTQEEELKNLSQAMQKVNPMVSNRLNKRAEKAKRNTFNVMAQSYQEHPNEMGLKEFVDLFGGTYIETPKKYLSALTESLVTPGATVGDFADILGSKYRNMFDLTQNQPEKPTYETIAQKTSGLPLWQSLPLGIAQETLETVTDPLNLIGLGASSKAIRAKKLSSEMKQAEETAALARTQDMAQEAAKVEELGNLRSMLGQVPETPSKFTKEPLDNRLNKIRFEQQAREGAKGKIILPPQPEENVYRFQNINDIIKKKQVGGLLNKDEAAKLRDFESLPYPEQQNVMIPGQPEIRATPQIRIPEMPGASPESIQRQMEIERAMQGFRIGKEGKEVPLMPERYGTENLPVNKKLLKKEPLPPEAWPPGVPTVTGKPVNLSSFGVGEFQNLGEIPKKLNQIVKEMTEKGFPVPKPKNWVGIMDTIHSFKKLYPEVYTPFKEKQQIEDVVHLGRDVNLSSFGVGEAQKLFSGETFKSVKRIVDQFKPEHIADDEWIRTVKQWATAGKNTPKNFIELIDRVNDAKAAEVEKRLQTTIADLVYKTSYEKATTAQKVARGTIFEPFEKRLSIESDKKIGKYLEQDKGLQVDATKEPNQWPQIKSVDEYIKRLGLQNASEGDKELARRAYEIANQFNRDAQEAYKQGLVTKEKLAKLHWKYMPRMYEFHEMGKLRPEQIKGFKDIVANPDKHTSEEVTWAKVLMDPKKIKSKINNWQLMLDKLIKSGKYTSNTPQIGYTKVPETWKESWGEMAGKYVKDTVYNKFKNEKDTIGLISNFTKKIRGIEDKKPGIFERKQDLTLEPWMERTNIPEKIQKLLGKIERPAYPAAKRTAQIVNDIMMERDLFKPMIQKSDTAFKQGGRAEDIWVLPEEYVKPRLLATPNENMMEYGGKQYKLISSDKFIAEGDMKKWGSLAGRFIERGVLSELKQAMSAPSQAEEIWNKVQGVFKAVLVPYNPASHINQIIGNTYFQFMAGVPVHRIIPDSLSAVKSILSKDELYYQAIKDGVFRGKYFNNTMGRGLYNFYKDVGTETVSGKTKKFLTSLGASPSRIYDSQDMIAKLSIYKNRRAQFLKQGMNEEESGKKAAEYVTIVPSYHRLPGIVQGLDKTLLPFLAFPVRALGTTARILTGNYGKDIKMALKYYGPAAVGLAYNEWLMNQGIYKPEDIAKQRSIFDRYIGLENFAKDPESYGRWTARLDALTGKKLYTPGDKIIETGKYMTGSDWLMSEPESTALNVPGRGKVTNFPIELYNKIATGRNEFGQEYATGAEKWKSIMGDYVPGARQYQQYKKKTKGSKYKEPEAPGKAFAQAVGGIRYQDNQPQLAESNLRNLQNRWNFLNKKYLRAEENGDTAEMKRLEKENEKLLKKAKAFGF